MMATTVVNSAFGYLFWLAAARLFPPSAVGLASAIISVSMVISLCSRLGIATVLIQSLPGDKDPAAWWLSLWTLTLTGTATTVVLSCAALLILPLVAPEFTPLSHPIYWLVFGVATLAGTVGSLLDSAFVAERVAGNMLARNTVVSGGKALLVLVLAATGSAGVLALLGAWSLAAVVGVSVGSALVIRRVGTWHGPRLRDSVRHGRYLVRRIVGNQLVGLGGSVPPLLLPLLVTERLSARDNAYFYTTWMMCGILLVVSPAIARSLLAEGVHSPAELRRTTKSALKILALILVPGMVVFLLVGTTFLAIFGPQYAQHSVLLLRLIVFSAIPDAITNVYVSVLVVERRISRAAYLNVGMGTGTVVLSWALLPTLGIAAVGWAWLAMQVAGCGAVGLDLARRRCRPDPSVATRWG
jgi:O-antigen/teichoic acid export membrane protein